MNLPVVDTFTPTYETWETRAPTLEEMLANGNTGRIKVKMTADISDAVAAARYIAEVAEDNRFGDYIQDSLSKNAAYKAWQIAMPKKTPTEISLYQKSYRSSDFAAVSIEIEQNGSFLSQGQYLFHGGLWPGGSNLVTTRPLSTSLCPQVALRNAEWSAKAYDAGRLDLWVLRVARPKSKAFVFKRKGTKLGHESEVLLASSACLALKKQVLIRTDYPASKCDCPDKDIPVYVLEIELS